MQGSRRLADGAADIGKGCLVIFLHRIEYILLAFHQRCHGSTFFFVDRTRFGHEIGDTPAVAVALDHQVDDAQMRSPETAHRGRLAEQRAFLAVDTRQSLILGTGEDQMLVTGKDGVDPVHAGKVQGGVFHALGIIVGVNPRVGEGDYKVAALFAHFRDEGLGGFDNVTRIGVAFQVAAVPIHDLRWHEADEADLDRIGLAGTVGDLFFNDHVGLQEKGVVSRVTGQRAALDKIGADDGEIGTGQHLHQEVQAVVEFVVAECCRVEFENVHALDDWVQVAFAHAAFIGDIVPHRVALQKVAIVDQNRVCRLVPDIADQCGCPGETGGVDRFVAVIVVRENMDMEVSGLHQAKVSRTFLGQNGIGVQSCREASCRRAHQKGAP